MILRTPLPELCRIRQGLWTTLLLVMLFLSMFVGTTLAQPDHDPPVITRVAPVDTFISCDTILLTVRVRDASPVNLSDAFITFNSIGTGLPDPRIVVFGDTLVVAQGPLHYAHLETIRVEFWPVRDTFGNSSPLIVWRFTVDRQPPTIGPISPAPRTEFVTTQPTFTMGMSDPTSGIRPDSVRLTINGRTFPVPSAGVTWSGGVLTFNAVAAGVRYPGGDTLHVCLSAADRAVGCGANRRDSCWTYTIQPGGPVVTLLTPFPGATSACPDQPIAIRIEDGNGIDPNSIRLTVQGRTFTVADREMHWVEPVLTFTPALGFYTEGETIRVSLDAAQDNLGNPYEGTPLRFYFLVDLSPPFVISADPPNRGLITNPQPLFTALIGDSLSPINPTTFTFSLGADTFRYDDSILTWDAVAGRLTFHPELANIRLVGGRVFWWCVFAEDVPGISDSLRCPPNASSNCYQDSVEASPPLVTLLSPLPGERTACPLQTISFRVVEAQSVIDSTVVLIIDGDSVRSGDPRLTWSGETLLVYTPRNPWHDADSVTFVLAPMLDPLQNASAPISGWFRVDLSGPRVVFTYPSMGAYSPDTIQFIRFDLRDDVSGVAPLSLRLTVDGTVYALPRADSALTFDSVTGQLIFHPERAGIRFNTLDTVTACLSAATDQPDYCGPNTLVGAPHCFTFIVDAQGPIIDPPPGATISCPDTAVHFYLHHGTPLLPATLLMTLQVGHATVESLRIGDARIVLAHDTLTFRPSGPWSHGDTVTLTLTVQDSLGRQVGPTGTTTTFYVDLLPPSFASPLPLPGSAIATRSPLISLLVSDDLSGVDSAALSMSVAGVPYRLGDPRLSWSAGRLQWTAPPDRFRGGDTVEVCVHAQDRVLPNYCGPNADDTCWSFYLPADGPVARSRDIQDGWYVACPRQAIGIYLTDAEGIDPASIRLVINGFPYTLPSPNLTLTDSLLLFDPGALSWSNGQVVTVALTRADDILANPLRTPLSYSFIVDLEPPLLLTTNPNPGQTIGSTVTPIRWAISDPLSGVDPASIAVTINGVPHRVDGSVLTWNGSFVMYHPDLATPYHPIDTIRACITACADLPDLCPANAMAETCFTFYVDAAPPTAGPAEVDSSTCPGQTFRFLVHDASGINAPSAVAVINGTDTLRYPAVIWFNDTVTVRPDMLFTATGPVTCCLIHVTDIWGNDIASPICETVFLDLTPPTIGTPSPACGDTLVNPQPTFAFPVTEAETQLDFTRTTVTRRLNGGAPQAFVVGDLGVTYSSGILQLSYAARGEYLAGGDQVEVCVTATDSAMVCPGNQATRCCNWTLSASGPLVTFVSPGPGVTTSCPDQFLSWRITSTSAIAESSLWASLDGSALGGLTWAGGLLNYSGAAWTGCEWHHVCVRARDVLGNAIAGGEACDSFRVDVVPPMLVATTPPTAMVQSPSLAIVTATFDDCQAITLDSLLVNDRALHSGDPGCTFAGESLTVRFPAADSVRDGDTLRLCAYVSDPRDSCGGNDTVWCWFYVIDGGPPIVHFTDTIGGYVSCPTETVYYYAHDPNGIVWDSVVVDDAGTIHHLGDVGLTITRDTLSYVHQGSYTDGQVVVLTISGVRDGVGNLAPPETIRFTVDLSAPTRLRIQPVDPNTVGIHTPARWILHDNLAGVDWDTLLIVTDRTPTEYQIGGLCLSREGDTLTWLPWCDEPVADSVGWLESRHGVPVYNYIDFDPLQDLAGRCPVNTITLRDSIVILDDDTLPPTFVSFSPESVAQDQAFRVSVVLEDTSGIWSPGGDSTGHGVYLIWDRDGNLDDGIAGYCMMSRVGSTDSFRTDCDLGPLGRSDTFVYRVFACDADGDNLDPADRTCTDSRSALGHDQTVVLRYPDIRVEGECLDFGQVMLDSFAILPLPVRNLGTAPLTIEFSTAHPTEFYPSTWADTLDPDESLDLPVTFRPHLEGRREDTLIITSNDPDTPILRVCLKGLGIPWYSALPNPFTPNGDGSNDSLHFTCKNPGALPVEITVFDLSNRVVRHLATTGEEVTWDGKNDDAIPQHQGLYLWMMKRDTNLVGHGTVTLAR